MSDHSETDLSRRTEHSMQKSAYTQYDERVPEALRKFVNEAVGAWFEAGGAHDSVPALVRQLVLASFLWDKGGVQPSRGSCFGTGNASDKNYGRSCPACNGTGSEADAAGAHDPATDDDAQSGAESREATT